jgi:hypothetical protein
MNGICDWLIITIKDLSKERVMNTDHYRAFALIPQGPTQQKPWRPCWCFIQKSLIKIILNWNTNMAAVTSCANALLFYEVLHKTWSFWVGITPVSRQFSLTFASQLATAHLLVKATKKHGATAPQIALSYYYSNWFYQFFNTRHVDNYVGPGASFLWIVRKSPYTSWSMRTRLMGQDSIHNVIIEKVMRDIFSR